MSKVPNTNPTRIHKGTSGAIRRSKSFFQTFTGCRQDGVESPVLFNVYLDRSAILLIDS